MDDIDFDEFATFISQNDENIQLKKAKEISKIKMMALKQILSILDKNAYRRKLDFWLPLKRYD